MVSPEFESVIDNGRGGNLLDTLRCAWAVHLSTYHLFATRIPPDWVM